LSSKNSKKKSFISELRSEGRINENFINIVSDLKLEELIAIKLEESANSTGGKFYNFPIWHSLPYICKDACYKFAYGVCDTKSDMAPLLGIPYSAFSELYKSYNEE
jgi:hypothetical protein